MQNPSLGMASHDLCIAKITILGATPGAIPGTDGNPHERFSFAHAFSERFFSKIGVVRVRQNFKGFVLRFMGEEFPGSRLSFPDPRTLELIFKPREG